jgi:hypothetical protein
MAAFVLLATAVVVPLAVVVVPVLEVPLLVVVDVEEDPGTTTRVPREVDENREFEYAGAAPTVGNRDARADTTVARAERKFASAALMD